MNAKWRRFMTSLAFASCVAMIGSACVVRTKGHVRTRGVVVVDATNPPPKPKYVKVQPREGYVWIRGRWVYKSNRWVWQGGHWERAQAGKAWQAGHWEKRGNRYHWVEGRWVVSASAGGSGGVVTRDHRQPKVLPYPTSAPPAPRHRNPGTRAGYVWVQGRWDWKGGKWVWVNGHWERAQANKTWSPGHWEKRGNRYVWVEGRWTVSASGGGGGVVTRDHRKPKVLPYPTSAPPAPRYKPNPGKRAGYVWIRGRWDWKGGKWKWTPGHWERAQANKAWVEGRWERKGDRYVWVEGHWKVDVKVRDHRKKNARPPKKKNEKVKSRRPR